MALTLGAGGGSGATALYRGGNGRSYTVQHFLRCPILFSPSPSRNANVIAKAAKKLSSKTGKFDSKNSKNKRSLTTTTQSEEEAEEGQWTVQIGPEDGVGGAGAVDVGGGGGDFEGYLLPDLPGLEKDFWEGPQWDGLGFFVQYMWAFGLPFALIACGIAVYTYNEGATDFKQTPAYKESIQSRGLLEEPEESNSNVFESNPTEEAPSLE